jgi:hypothetical protein
MLATSHDSIVYANLALTNNEDRPIKANILESRTTALLKSVQGYEMSVVRFDCDTSLLPPIIVPMQTPPTVAGVAPSTLSITLTEGAEVYQEFVQFDTSPSTPGFVYAYSELITRLNTAAAVAFAQFGAPTPANPPVFWFNASTQRVELFHEETGYGTAAPLMTIGINAELQNYLRSLPMIFIDYGQPNGVDFIIDVNNDASLFAPVAGTRTNLPAAIIGLGDPLRRLPQDTVTLSGWNGALRLVLTSENLPNEKEALPCTCLSNQLGTSGSNQGSVLTDVSLTTLTDPLAELSSVSYLPTAEYRMISLIGSSELRDIQLSLTWVDRKGVARPVFIPPGRSFSAKLMFRPVMQ